MEINTPTLLIDKEKCLLNIQAMADKAKAANAELRPHFKTPYSAEIASWFRGFGVTACTVSSVSMARYFAENGWDDITIAFPYNPLEHKAINELASKVKINILIESFESLNHAKAEIKNPVGYFIKIDVGTHRTGIDPRNEDLIKTLVQGESEKTPFKGFLAHAGHTYGAKDATNIKWIFDGAEKVLTSLKEKFGGIISYGDTPSCSVIDDLSAFDELRPGNFVFYDWMQHEIGSCKFDAIAVCMACPVVAIHPERNEVVLYGGAVHFSKDFVLNRSKPSYGKVVALTESGWGNVILGDMDRLSQEHGIARLNEKAIQQVKIGDLIGVIPVHSCLTADLQGHYRLTTGEKVEKIIKA
ncbi:MAG: D-TA family PLP-dependent enzyme [Ekhidna sp.]